MPEAAGLGAARPATAASPARLGAGPIALGLTALVLLAWPLVMPRFLVSTATEVLIFAILAMSLDLLIGYTGLTSLGHAAFFGIGAYTAGIVSQRLGEHLLVTLPAALLAAALAALLIGLVALRTSGVYFLMITLALAQLVYAVAQKWTWLTGGSNGLVGVPRPSLLPGLDLGDPTQFYFLVLAAFAASAALLWRLVRSPFGHALVGIRENEARMRAIGYRTPLFKLAAFVVAGALGGLAGALYVQFNGIISPQEVYWSMSGLLVVMVVLGGSGTLVGPAIGAALVLVLQDSISSRSEHWQLVLGLIFIGVVLAAPRGVVGLVQRLAGRGARR